MKTPRRSMGMSARTAVVVGTLVGVAAGVVALSTIGPAQASRPQISVNPPDPGPFDPPTLPPFTFATFLTVPTATLIELPDDSPTTTSVDTTTTSATETTTTTESTTTTLETTTSTSEPPSGQGAPSSAEPEYTLVIDLAQVNCDGTIHVEYTTTADPAPAGPASHIVMYNPTNSPTAFTVVETPDNPPNGAFVFDGAGAPDLTYRIFVIGLFDPATPDGPKVIDQADVVLVDGC